MKREILAALLVLSLAACGDSDTTTSEAEKAAAPEPMAETAAETESPAAAPEASEPAEEAVARTPSPEGAKVVIVSPKNGDIIKGPVPVIFSIEGMEVAPAGADTPNSGHHHLLIDTKIEDYNAAIPNDETHKHFGAGQTEAAVGLPPGEHTLQAVFADMNHITHDPPVESEVITITVE
jgi:uncharacterized protein DUF4399